jgi:tRNA pseudouridine32 synthase/23S rRNA pseudouridine746 synthase
MLPANIATRLLYRDGLMLVLDKPAGLAVHPGGRDKRRDSLTDHLDTLRFGLPRRPEIVHRLDRDTSGCLVLGRHPKALARLNALFRDGLVEKTYWALVEGGPEADEGEIDGPIAPEPGGQGRQRVDPAGQPSLTRWRVLGRAAMAGLTWLEMRPVTGRTHQLRVHARAAGWPIHGDRLYGSASVGLQLHARSVRVPLYPKKPPIEVTAPPPPHMTSLLERLSLADVAVRSATSS